MLVAYSVSLDLIRSLRTVVDQLRSYDAEAVKQVTHAASSISHNLAEGSRRSGRDVRRFYVMAHGSAAEIRAALDVADAWGWKVETAHAAIEPGTVSAPRRQMPRRPDPAEIEPSPRSESSL